MASRSMARFFQESLSLPIELETMAASGRGVEGSPTPAPQGENIQVSRAMCALLVYSGTPSKGEAGDMKIVEYLSYDLYATNNMKKTKHTHTHTHTMHIE